MKVGGAILHYPRVCCSSVSQVSRETKLSLLSCISTTADPQLQQLGLQLHLGDVGIFTDSDWRLQHFVQGLFPVQPVVIIPYGLSSLCIIQENSNI